MEAAISRPLTAVARVFFARFATLLIIIIATLSRPSSATSTLLREGRNGFWPQYFYLPVAAASASGLYYDHYRLQPHPSMWRQASENVAPDSINIEQKASEADARISEADEIELHLESRLGSVDITENNVARQSNTSTVGKIHHDAFISIFYLFFGSNTAELIDKYSCQVKGLFLLKS